MDATPGCKTNQLICCLCYRSQPGWNILLTCDATRSALNVTCALTYNYGTTFSEMVRHHQSVSETVETAISAGLFDIFGATLEVSETTGYERFF